jgi:hypothetical protein
MSRATGEKGLGLLDLDDTAALVVAALGTGAMRHPLLVALWALVEADRRQEVVSPPLTLTGVRMSAFWIRHNVLSAAARRLCVNIPAPAIAD